MHASSNPSNKIILFIPFSFSENNAELYNTAIIWRENARSAGKKVPEIVIYSSPNETGTEYDTAICNQFSPETTPAGTTIFMLAHGTGDPRWVVNQSEFTADTNQLPIELAAERAKQMGLTPEIANNLASFRLYSCEETLEGNSTRALTINFAHGLGTTYQYLRLAYYTARVFEARATPFDNHVRKRAMLAHHYRAFILASQHPEYKHLKLDTDSLKTHVFVAASKFKQTLFVSEALKENNWPIDRMTELCLKINAPMNQHALINFSLFSALVEAASIADQQPDLDRTKQNKFIKK